MKNPFKVYSPVMELVKSIKEEPHKWNIENIGSKGEHLWIAIKGDCSWYLNLVPIVKRLFWYCGDKSNWLTWAEKRYIYDNIMPLITKTYPPNSTREGWKNKLGITE